MFKAIAKAYELGERMSRYNYQFKPTSQPPLRVGMAAPEPKR